MNDTSGNSSTNSTLTFIVIGVVIILCLGLIVGIIGYLALTTGTNINTTNTTTTSEPVNNLVATLPFIKITTPEDSQTVNGLISVSGQASYHIRTIKVQLFDADDNNLGISNVSLSATSDAPINWSTQLDVIVSPSKNTGKIVVTSEDPVITQTININFESYSSSPDNLVIYSPLKDQVMFSNDINIRGEALGLFEGVLGVRLKDANGNIIYTKSLTIPNQLEGFTPFEFKGSIDDLSTIETATGVWEFYTNSAMDGSENILQSIPVRFL